MNAYKQYLTIEDPNHIVLSGLPFKPGQRVEVIILAEDKERETVFGKSTSVIQRDPSFTPR